MFKLLSNSKVGKAFITGGLVLTSMSVQAELTSYNANGVDLVYSSVSDVTWTKDANILGTWIASSKDEDGNGTFDIVDAIIAASPTINNSFNWMSPTGIYTLTSTDFSSNGSTTWFGAIAYVNYLNHISYGGSKHWYLPTVENTSFGYNTPNNGIDKGDELVELFYQELNGTPHNRIPNTNTFDNEQASIYWTGTEYMESLDNAWLFVTRNGNNAIYEKYQPYYAWAASPGMLAAVPEPDNVGMLLAGLGLMSVVALRRIYSM